MRSPWRELGETRTVTVDGHASLGYLSRGANSKVELRAKKPLVTVSPPPRTVLESRFAPFR